MNVLWLAAYPHPIRDLRTHPVPWMTTLARHLTNVPDLKLTIVSVSPVIPQTERFTHEGIDFVYVKVPNDKLDLLTGYQQRIRRVRRALAQLTTAFDVVHVHGSELQYQVMAAQVAAPKVLSVQGIMSECLKVVPRRLDYRQLSWRLAEYYERTYLPTMQHFICRTHWDTAIMRQKNAQATIHQNWEIMRDVFYTPVRPADQSRTLLFVGGNNRMKGVVEVLVMYDQLVRQQPDLRLLITGNGNRQHILSLIDELKLPHIPLDQVEHRGYLDAQSLWEAYHQALCLVHPSHVDNSPNSVCEAQLAGLPVIASNVGGVSSLIEHNRTGLLVPLDADALAGAVRRLLAQPDYRRRLAAEARREALQRHDPERILATTCAIYSTVSEGQPVQPAYVLIS